MTDKPKRPRRAKKPLGGHPLDDETCYPHLVGAVNETRQAIADAFATEHDPAQPRAKRMHIDPSSADRGDATAARWVENAASVPLGLHQLDAPQTPQTWHPAVIAALTERKP